MIALEQGGKRLRGLMAMQSSQLRSGPSEGGAPGVDESLRGFRDAKVYFETFKGNHGDRLIELGARIALSEADLRLVPTKEDAEVFVLNGGARTEDWPEVVETLGSYLGREAPILVLPTTFGNVMSHLGDRIRSRNEPALLYAREQGSLDILRRLDFGGTVRLGMDHDMAFHLEGSAFLEDLKRRSARKHLLIVERTDVEAATSSRQPFVSNIRDAFPTFSRRLLPTAAKRFIVHRLRAMRPYELERNASTPFSNLARSRAIAEMPELAEAPVYAADISQPHLYDFEEFLTLIAEAAGVIANRLHVAILAALLGKPTFVYAGRGHKFAGVYEYSLRSRQNVRFMAS